MSQARAISKPPPKAAPSIAAIVGTGRLPMKRMIFYQSRRRTLYLYRTDHHWELPYITKSELNLRKVLVQTKCIHITYKLW